MMSMINAIKSKKFFSCEVPADASAEHVRLGNLMEAHGLAVRARVFDVGSSSRPSEFTVYLTQRGNLVKTCLFTQGSAHRVIVRDPGPLFGEVAMRVPFGESHRDSIPAPPSPVDVFHSMITDACLGLESFEDFCDSLGLDTDSRKAHESWRECVLTKDILEGSQIDLGYWLDQFSNY